VARKHNRGYEAIHMIRKGQARWSANLLHRFVLGI
jgi:hypothetical protein